MILARFLAALLVLATANWPMFGHDPARSGVDAGDTSIAPGNVSQLRARWQISLGTAADSSPIVLSGVNVSGVTRTMLYQTNLAGTTFGIEAYAGTIVWRFNTHGPGITQSTPVADPSGSAIYAPGTDGYVHKLDAATGHELAAPGFPAHVTLATSTEKIASGLNLANGYLYATTSGYIGDREPYVGHVVAVHLSDGVTHVFNTLCSGVHKLIAPASCAEQRSGIWSRGGVVVDPDPAMHGQLYVATGNGHFDANAGGADYGDTVIALSPDASTVAGSYTPATYTKLEEQDGDLGCTNPALIPRQAGSNTPLMLVQGGKDRALRLVDRAPLPGVGGELQKFFLPEDLVSNPAVWTDASNVTYVYLALRGVVQAWRVETNAQGASHLAGAWRATVGTSSGSGGSPAIVNGVLFDAIDHAVIALDVHTGRQLWSSAQPSAGRTTGTVHWQAPIVANGWLYSSDEQGHLTAFAR